MKDKKSNKKPNTLMEIVIIACLAFLVLFLIGVICYPIGSKSGLAPDRNPPSGPKPLPIEDPILYSGISSQIHKCFTDLNNENELEIVPDYLLWNGDANHESDDTDDTTLKREKIDGSVRDLDVYNVTIE